mmetsp:Transcript_10323/g.22418  ORF Transcript_10323/g.22418 Transcript_10323/m.22418 type:complete len:667 (-) Transcript_10323:51-2051(-)
MVAMSLLSSRIQTLQRLGLRFGSVGLRHQRFPTRPHAFETVTRWSSAACASSHDVGLTPTRRHQRLPTSPIHLTFQTTITRQSSTESSNNDDEHLTSLQIEEQQHLAKQLSPLSEKSQLEQNAWKKLVKGYPPKRWDATFGLHHYNSARYEHEGLTEIHSRSYAANVLLEIRDVRVPASSHHPSFTRLAKHRTHLICYTHADLIDAPTRDRVERWTAAVWPNSMTIFVDTRSEGKRNDQLHYFDQLYDGLLKTIESRGNNLALTVGVANVGKSSVLMSLLRLAKQRGAIPKNAVKINTGSFNVKKKQRGKARLRKGSAPDTEDKPGKTRTITEYLLKEKPKSFFMDVPGITPPAFFFGERPEAWFGYGATNLLPLLRDGTEDVALQKSFCEYVLHCANRDGVFQYVDKLYLDGPTDDIDVCLEKLGNKWKDKVSEDKLWLKRCETFLKLYNTGNLGPLILDDMSDTSWKAFEFKDEHFARRIRDEDDDNDNNNNEEDYGGRSPSRDRRQQRGQRGVRAPKFDRETMDKRFSKRSSDRAPRFDRERRDGRRRNGRAPRFDGEDRDGRQRRSFDDDGRAPRFEREGRDDDRRGNGRASRFDRKGRDGDRRDDGRQAPRFDRYARDRHDDGDEGTARFDRETRRGGTGSLERKVDRQSDDDDDDWFRTP